jgi:general secretion pathway protein F
MPLNGTATGARPSMRSARRNGRAFVTALSRREPTRRDAAAAIARLAALTGAGVAAGDALASSARSGNPLLARLHAAVRRGQPLSVAMSSWTLPFLEAEIAVVRAGERGGSTARALALLSERMEREAGGRRRIASALAYPFLLLIGAVAALSFLSIVVLPSFTSLYAGSKAELPAVTRMLLAFGGFVREAAVPTAVGTVSFVVLAGWMRARSRRVARAIDGLLVSLPVLAPLHAPRAAHEAAALLALLLESGCEADEALALAGKAAPNRVFAQRLAEALRALASTAAATARACSRSPKRPAATRRRSPASPRSKVLPRKPRCRGSAGSPSLRPCCFSP